MKIADDKAYWDRMAQGYDRHTQKSGKLYKRLIEMIETELPQDASVLDIGTGTGDIPLQICQAVGHVEAIDFSEEMIRQARLKAAQNGIENIVFRVQDTSHLPYENQFFDRVIITNVVHILPHPGQILNEAYRVLKDNGKLIVPTYLHNESWMSRIISHFLKMKGHPVHTRFDSGSLKGFIEEHKFAVVRQIFLKGIMPLSFVAAIKQKA